MQFWFLRPFYFPNLLITKCDLFKLDFYVMLNKPTSSSLCKRKQVFKDKEVGVKNLRVFLPGETFLYGIQLFWFFFLTFTQRCCQGRQKAFLRTSIPSWDNAQKLDVLSVSQSLQDKRNCLKDCHTHKYPGVLFFLSLLAFFSLINTGGPFGPKGSTQSIARTILSSFYPTIQCNFPMLLWSWSHVQFWQSSVQFPRPGPCF